MALIPCNACSHPISRRARTCPQCGDPQRASPWTDRLFKPLVGLAALLFVGMCVLAMILGWVTRTPFDVDRPDVAKTTTATAPLHVA